MPNPGVVLERVGSTEERLRQLPYEKRVCKTEAYPAVSRPDKEYTGLSVAEFAGTMKEQLQRFGAPECQYARLGL